MLLLYCFVCLFRYYVCANVIKNVQILIVHFDILCYGDLLAELLERLDYVCVCMCRKAIVWLAGA